MAGSTEPLAQPKLRKFSIVCPPTMEMRRRKPGGFKVVSGVAAVGEWL